MVSQDFVGSGCRYDDIFYKDVIVPATRPYKVLRFYKKSPDWSTEAFFFGPGFPARPYLTGCSIDASTPSFSEYVDVTIRSMP